MATIDKLLDDIFAAAEFQISNLLPSEWAELNRFMTSDVSSMEGTFKFDNSPYTKAILDCLSPDSPIKVIAVMKGSQLGFSTSVIENGIGYIISQQPGNILFLVGHETLVADAEKKIGVMLDSSGLRDVLQSSSKSKNKTRTGDTTLKKEFPGGELKFGIANHKALRNISLRYGFIDDYEAMKGSTKESGDTLSMIKARFKAYDKKMKLYLISTPETKENSNIEYVYLKGDQRKWHVPCPCCGEFIVWEWEIDSEINAGEKAGIYWELDEKMKLIPESVGYVCQKCGGFFDDRNKNEIINAGHFRATAEPEDEDHVSFHLSALYAPIYMQGWLGYVKDYLEANPPGGVRNEAKHQVFMNQCLGLPYEQAGSSASADTLQKNIRNYEVGTIPETMSYRDGNGKIIMLTMGADMNGLEDDARLDWEIIAWSETGSSYSVDHGSIGTFVPRENQMVNKIERDKWTYRRGHAFSVWPELDKVMTKIYKTDTGRSMNAFCGCLDSGYLATAYAYPYIDATNLMVFGVKGSKDTTTGIHLDADYKAFTPARERGNLWSLNVNHLKDILYTQMSLTWNEHMSISQSPGFMNFPIPSGGKYLLQNYFSHFEAEHKVIGTNNRFVWKKKTSASQNHLYDCRIYGMAAREILLSKVFEEAKIKGGTWADFVKIIKGKA